MHLTNQSIQYMLEEQPIIDDAEDSTEDSTENIEVKPDAAEHARDNDIRDALAAARAMQDAERKRSAEQELQSND